MSFRVDDCVECSLSRRLIEVSSLRFRPNRAAISQPRASDHRERRPGWVNDLSLSALKGRNTFAQSLLRPFWASESPNISDTQGVALSWPIAARLGLKNINSATSKFTHGVTLLILFVVALLHLPVDVVADEVVDEAVVRRWVARLDADRKADRLRAEDELLKLGPAALKWLPEPGVLGSRSAAEAVKKIRVKLERQKAETAVEASRLTIGGMRTVAELVPRLSQDTGNLVVAEDVPKNLFAGLVELPERPTFWQAIGALTQQQPLTWRCEGTPTRLRLLTIDPKRDKSDSPTDILAATTSKAFRIALRSARPRDVVGEAAGQLMRLDFDVTAEPRLRPLFLKCAAADVQVTGLRESKSTDSPKPEEWKPYSADSKIELTFGQGRRQLAFPVDYRLPAGGGWKSLSVVGQLFLETAAGEEPIDFPTGADSRGVSRRRGGVTVKLVDWESDANSNDRTLTIRATVTYDTGGMAFESHRSWMLYNVAGLRQPREKQAADDLLKPTHAESDLQPDGSIAVTYRFEKLPRAAQDFGLRYVAPTLILDVPVEFEFRDVPLNRSER